MNKYKIKEFNIPELKGISQTTIKEHLKLYSGYVNHTNLILEQIDKLKETADDKQGPEDTYALSEMQRRFSFEFDGMKNHEIYFASFENGPAPLKDEGTLRKEIEKEWGSFDNWLKRFKDVAKTRGVGWAMLYFDKENNKLLNSWVDEQHLGHLTGLKPILALDMWEHSFVADYQPSGKGNYIDDFFENLNWEVVEEGLKNINSKI
jgi:Fe-Mn family superoxide dismutase